MDIPVGMASVFMTILIGYFVLTVWFGNPSSGIVKAPKKNDDPASVAAATASVTATDNVG